MKTLAAAFLVLALALQTGHGPQIKTQTTWDSPFFPPDPSDDDPCDGCDGLGCIVCTIFGP